MMNETCKNISKKKAEREEGEGNGRPTFFREESTTPDFLRTT